jgi:hypothetical protein
LRSSHLNTGGELREADLGDQLINSGHHLQQIDEDLPFVLKNLSDSFKQIFANKTGGTKAEFNSFAQIMNLTAGFLNQTQFSFGENRTECQFGIEKIYFSGKNATEILTREWFNWFRVLEAFDKYLLMTYEVHTITFSCYHGVMELWDLLQAYY